MKQHPFVIPSGSFTASLVGTTQALAASGAIQLPAQSTAGLAAIQIFAIGSQPFCIVVQEAPSPAGPFVTTHTFCSTASGGSQIISQSFAPSGNFAQFTIVNGPSPQTISFSANGSSVASQVQTTGSPGSKITSVDTAVPAGTTQPLPAIPAGTRRMTVQNKGPAGTWVLVRESTAAANTGKLLPRLGETTYGGADGALAPLVVQDVSTAVGGDPVATTIDVQFEGN